ncbi:MAG TPA: DUF2752 domain-containing protein [Thermoanaerobaculia bacterium]|nr:DUF2752 domain-containing protein [Thermoanaerobaculia bacterium]
MAAAALLHGWAPSGDPAQAVCLLRRLFHLPCPGCGLTRAFACLAKGEWSAAVALHPLAPVLAAELILGWAAWGIGIVSQRRLAVRFDTLLLVHAAAFVALWLGRVATGTLPW